MMTIDTHAAMVRGDQIDADIMADWICYLSEGIYAGPADSDDTRPVRPAELVTWHMDIMAACDIMGWATVALAEEDIL